MTDPTERPMHYWISYRYGYVLSSSKYCPIKKGKQKRDKVRYIGFTFDESWPKRMNTGRLFYAQVSKKKPSADRKTASKPIGKAMVPAVPAME
jgi:hypothetical protein